MDFLLKLRQVLAGKAPSLEELASEKRSSPRIICRLEVFCRRGEDDEVRAVINDLGLYGLRLTAPFFFRKDDVLEIAPVRGQELLEGVRCGVNTLRATVAWSRRKGKSSETVMGLRYSDTRSRLRDSWVASLLTRMGFSVGYRAQKRRSIRLPVQLPVFYRTPRGEDSRGGTAVDLGMGGVLLKAPSGLPQEDEIRLILGPLGNLAALCCSGRITHSSYVKKSECWYAGVAFIKMTESQNRLLTQYIETLLDEQARAGRDGKPA